MGAMSGVQMLDGGLVITDGAGPDSAEAVDDTQILPPSLSLSSRPIVYLRVFDRKQLMDWRVGGSRVELVLTATAV